MPQGEIWLIDEDVDDSFILEEILKDVQYQQNLRTFRRAEDCLEHLANITEAPFMILCDVNIARVDGFELRERMLREPDKKFHSVPFIYWSSQASEKQITRAYELSAHGFFIKVPDIDELKETFSVILNYWQRSKMPAKDKS